jgi:hypothetical protein
MRTTTAGARSFCAASCGRTGSSGRVAPMLVDDLERFVGVAREPVSA